MRVAILVLTAAIAVPWPANAAPRARERGFELERVARIPCGVRACLTGLAFDPTGRDLYVNVRTGQVRLIRDGRLQARAVATVETTTTGEGGLLGLALDPRFESDPWIYLFHTTPDGDADRVIRVRGSEREVLMPNLPSGAAYHHGGILAFGPDGMLYVSHGEAHDARRAQDPRVLGGKIYRIRPDGSIPDDNPFRGEPTWSYGHRNPFGLAFDPKTGTLWSSENGPGDHDEVNVIRRGANYGWPDARGRARRPGFVDPTRDYVTIIVPTMMTFGGSGFPLDHGQDLFMGSYGDAMIRRFVLDRSRTRIARETAFVTGERVVGMTAGPDGVYFTTDQEVWRIRPPVGVGVSPLPSSPSPGPQRPMGNGNATPWWVGVVAGIAGAVIAIVLFRRR